MAIGDGFGQLLRPVGTTPLSSGVTVVRDQSGAILENLGQQLSARAMPAVIDQAAQRGAEDGAAGTIEERGMTTDWDVAYMRAAQAAAIANADTQRDETIADLTVQYQDDPQGFEVALTQAQQAAVAAASPRLAVRVEQSWQRVGQRQLNRLRVRQAGQIAERARGDLQAKEQTLRGALEGFARAGALGTEDAEEAMTALNVIIDEKVANPVWGYGPVEAQRDRQLLAATLASLTAGRGAVAVFEEAVGAGETLAGAQAKSRQALLERFDNDPALAGMTEAERQRMLNAADNALVERVTQRRQEITARREEERAAEQEINDRHRSNFDSMRMAADGGGLTEGQINAAYERGDINASQADGLRGETRSAASRAYTERQRARAEADRAEADRRRAEADNRRAANEARRDRETAARESRRDARERERAEREQGQSAYMELQDLAPEQPEQAVTRARDLRRNGIIDERQLRSIERAASAEWRRDYADVLANTRRSMGRTAPSRDIDTMNDSFERWILSNPTASPEQVSRWSTAFVEGYARRRGAQVSPGGGGSRTRAQIDRDIAAVTGDRTIPARAKAERLARLNAERRAAQR